MFKVPKQSYTAEFKVAAVQRVKDGQGFAVVARELGMSEQTLRNWVKAEAAGKLNGAGTKPVTPEQMELSRMRAEIKRLQMELEIGKKSGSILREGPAVRYAWIDQQVGQYPLSSLCGVLSVSVNGYRAWTRGGKSGRTRLTDTQLLTLIRTVHAEVKGAYGSPRMTEEIRDRGFPASKERVERLMREHGIRARHKRRYRVTTDSKHKLPVAPNLLNREFTPAAPNQVFSSDITYIWTDEGWLYLAVVLDLFNREVVGWSIKPRMTADLVTDALTMAWFRRRPAPGALCHSDRGSQYASHEFQRKLSAYGMRCSMSRKGNCWDNAPTESFFNSLKNERVHATRYRTHQDAKADLFEYIEVFYNRSRRHSSLGFVSPEQFLRDWIKAQQTKDAAA
ncbi:TPA: IS3 family transposase [Burkholderia aenigmatica]|uniref:IS3 family transposase n=1 Tax=Burkholderia sp. AU45251 TaxID=3059204 RepID=UPI00265174C7|nr:IS3 family transposase [Burkholderia sp. AU45251]HDR9488435.1 IS3 family transposase [Burkholderia aenigmatica]MDN7521279.1 IS3 family transposase [Burkholderia sp. AU45251]HDR9520258.1 IS3 family transposase [Burkholderia aenigmatica]HDR9597350.1 IS3 family transposase [Burkholderia aenigmatica]HDR9605423.1 IS3 family transposase [Burkholderia aenigmatica]